MGEIIEIELTPTKKLFYGNAFGIYGAVSEYPGLILNTYGNFTIKGKMQELSLNVVYKAKVEGVDDPKYGFGYQVHAIYQEIPQTLEGQKDYLSTVMTELQLNEICKVYPNEDIIQLIKDDKFDYKKIKGIGEVTYKRIKKKILDTLDWANLLSVFGKYGLKYEVLKKLVDHFGSVDLAIQEVNNNVYCLTELSGIGFKKADVIARNMGIAMDDPNRIRAGIIYTIQEEQSNGHTYVNKVDLLKKGEEILQVDQGLIEYEIDRTKGLYIGGDRVALKYMFEAEQYISDNLKEMLKHSIPLDIDVDNFIKKQEDEFGITLTSQQKRFLYNFKKYNVSFLIGYAGTGKSFLQKLLINLIKQSNMTYKTVQIYDEEHDVNAEEGVAESNLTYKLLAPTGKAAKILASYVEDSSASTIHRAIGFGKHKKDESSSIEITEDIIVIDEVSMMDVQLAAMTLKKISNPKARIIFIGDDYQIPSVGAGSFLKNCLDSNLFPVTKLNQVFRQSEGGILDIATKVRNGEKFISDDFVGEMKFGLDTILRSVSQEWMESGYQYYYKKLLEEFEPEDIMVLSSTKKGKLGTVMINKNIQDIVNMADTAKAEIKYHDDCAFRIDDYIINTKNTYSRADTEGNIVDIVNGDTGVITDIVHKDIIKNKDNIIINGVEEDEIEEKTGIYVEFDFGTIKMGFDEMNQLLHAWCLTMHKSQGSAAKSVLIVLDKAHKFQLNANLIYTAITRCREKLIILCQPDVINSSLKKFENMRRNTFLKDLLVSGEAAV